MLSKVRHFVHKKKIIISLSLSFLNHTYSILVLFGQRILIPLRLYILQKKSLRLMYFLNCDAHTTLLFMDSNRLKFPDKIALEYCIFIKNYFNQTLPTPFKNWFTLSLQIHIHITQDGLI